MPPACKGAIKGLYPIKPLRRGYVQPIETITTDTLIIGMGGSGLMAAITARQTGASVLCLTKLPPKQSHTSAAQGGINAALGNVTGDDWRWHAYDTIKGADWIGDHDVIAYMCEQAPRMIELLDRMGVPFSRDSLGHIYQRPYGGQSTEFGQGPLAYRACAAADFTGKAIMDCLIQAALECGVQYKQDSVVLDLVFHPNNRHQCIGVLAWDMDKGSVCFYQAHHVILATGGYCQVYEVATTASSCTGDGNAMCFRAGIPLQDMEFLQFHPTGLYPSGVLISEAARAEGAYLTNAQGERFMERYAPHYKELASRDVIARAISQEISEGRGVNNAHVWLHLHDLPLALIEERLPTVRETVQCFSQSDVLRDPIPVAPTAHYSMGGITTSGIGQVVTYDQGAWVEITGLYAVGEAACLSVHGANRLGCNSLLDLMVFGHAVGEACGQAPERPRAPVSPAAYGSALSRFYRMGQGQTTGEEIAAYQHEMQHIMHEYVGVYRHHTGLSEAVKRLEEGWKRVDALAVNGSTLMWNSELQALIELKNLWVQALCTAKAALLRTESRGAHYRYDFPERNDETWRVHSVMRYHHGAIEHHSRAVRNTSIPGIPSLTPRPREY